MAAPALPRPVEAHVHDEIAAIPQKGERPTFDHLRAADPQVELAATIVLVRELIDEDSIMADAASDYCRGDDWFGWGGIRYLALLLAGPQSTIKSPELRTNEAAAVLMFGLFNRLPACRHPRGACRGLENERVGGPRHVADPRLLGRELVDPWRTFGPPKRPARPRPRR
jgi:hypothetical protein